MENKVKHFNWMVFNKIDRVGIWFTGTRNRLDYVFYWNPIRVLGAILSGTWSLGFFPLSIRHIKFIR